MVQDGRGRARYWDAAALTGDGPGARAGICLGVLVAVAACQGELANPDSAEDGGPGSRAGEVGDASSPSSEGADTAFPRTADASAVEGDGSTQPPHNSSTPDSSTPDSSTPDSSTPDSATPDAATGPDTNGSSDSGIPALDTGVGPADGGTSTVGCVGGWLAERYYDFEDGQVPSSDLIGLAPHPDEQFSIVDDGSGNLVLRAIARDTDTIYGHGPRAQRKIAGTAMGNGVRRYELNFHIPPGQGRTGMLFQTFEDYDGTSFVGGGFEQRGPTLFLQTNPDFNQPPNYGNPSGDPWWRLNMANRLMLDPDSIWDGNYDSTQWHSLRFEAKWSTGSDGWYEMHIDGVSLGRRNGPTLLSGNSGTWAPSFDFGVYGGTYDETNTVKTHYIDNVRVSRPCTE